KEALSAFVTKKVRALRQEKLPTILEGFDKLSYQIEAYTRLHEYLKTTATAIHESNLSREEKDKKLELLMQGASSALTSIEKGKFEKPRKDSKTPSQLATALTNIDRMLFQTSTGKIRDIYTTRMLNYVNKADLELESRFSLSEKIQNEVV